MSNEKRARRFCRRAFLGALKVKYGSVHCEGFQRAIAKPFGRSRRSEIPCNMKNQVAQVKNTRQNPHREQRLWGKIANSPIVHFTTKIRI